MLPINGPLLCGGGLGMDSAGDSVDQTTCATRPGTTVECGVLAVPISILCAFCMDFRHGGGAL